MAEANRQTFGFIKAEFPARTFPALDLIQSEIQPTLKDVQLHLKTVTGDFNIVSRYGYLEQFSFRTFFVWPFSRYFVCLKILFSETWKFAKIKKCSTKICSK